MQSNCTSMTETGNTFHAVSSLCDTSSITLVGDWRALWRALFSAIHDQMFLMGDKSVDRAGQGCNRIPCVSSNVRTWRQHNQNIISNVPVTAQITIDSNYRCACRISNISPNYHIRCKPPKPISNASRWRTISSEPPDTHTVIRILHIEPGLWKDDIVLLLNPALSFGAPLCCLSLYAALLREAALRVAMLPVSADEYVIAPY